MRLEDLHRFVLLRSAEWTYFPVFNGWLEDPIGAEGKQISMTSFFLLQPDLLARIFS